MATIGDPCIQLGDFCFMAPEVRWLAEPVDWDTPNTEGGGGHLCQGGGAVLSVVVGFPRIRHWRRFRRVADQ